jgi:serine/threonine protein kinase
VALALARPAGAATPPTGRVEIPNPVTPSHTGGNGRIYKAYDRAGRAFAFKLTGNNTTTQAEGNMLAALKGYSGWPEHYGTWMLDGALTGNLGIVEDWVEGVPLHQFTLKSHGQAVRMVRKLLAHLSELHRRGYVHGDIKPINVMINPTTGSKSLILLDFGLAQRMGSVVGPRTGTPEYMSPEQWRGSVWNEATDVFGAAGVLYFLLTRRDPFPGARQLYDAQVPPQ